MLKKLLAVVTATALLSVSVFAAPQVAEYPAEEYGYESYYEETMEAIVSGGTIIIEAPMAASTTSVTMFRSFAERIFDDVIDQLYFNQFRDGFENVRRHSIDIGQVVRHGNFEMEVLSSVAIAGQSFTVQNWAFPPFTFVEATGVFLLNEDAEYEAVTGYSVDVYTFISLRDTTGQVDFSWGTIVDLAQVFDVASPLDWSAPPMSHGMFGSANLIFVDEEAGISYFVVRHSTSITDEESISVDFTIERIMADQRNVSEEIVIDFAELLANHEATFIEAGNIGGSSSQSMEMFEVLGEDFDMFSSYREIMERNELNIHVFDDFYITNIALVDDLLKIQISEPLFTDGWGSQWSHIRLINTSAELVDIHVLLEEMDFEDIDEAFWAEMATISRARYPHSLFSIEVTEITDYFMPIGDRRLIERVYHIEDMSILDYLAFSGNMTYFAVMEYVNLSAETFEVPVLNHRLLLEDTQVQVMGENYLLTDIQVSSMEIRFRVDGDGELFNIVGGRSHVPMHELFEINLVFADGTETTYMFFSTGMSFSQSDTTGQRASDLSINFGGNFIDVENLVGIRVNGVLVEAR